MIASRAIPMEALAFETIPRSSGPRCRCRSIIRDNADSRAAWSSDGAITPAMPHMKFLTQMSSFASHSVCFYSTAHCQVLLSLIAYDFSSQLLDFLFKAKQELNAPIELEDDPVNVFWCARYHIRHNIEDVFSLDNWLRRTDIPQVGLEDSVANQTQL